MINPLNSYRKTRIAPTPSGFLHLGNVLSFCITASLARKRGASILLRIDDLDQPRVNDQYIQDIFNTLNFLEIPWDEGPRDVKEFKDSYSQQHRLPLYEKAIEELRDNRLVFACTCTRRQVNARLSCNCLGRGGLSTENASLRLITGDKGELSIKTYNGQIQSIALPRDMKDFVVKRKDGLPAYQLTSMIDDLFYGIDLIVRGGDLWPSTLAQYQLALSLGRNDFREICFHHHPLLNEASGNKLSKSAGSTSVRYLREIGKRPVDIFRIIATMLSIDETVISWQQLSELVIDQQNFN